MNFPTASNRADGGSDGFRVRWTHAPTCALTAARSPKEDRTGLSSSERGDPAIRPAGASMARGLSLKMLASITAMLAMLPIATAPLRAAGGAEGSIGATSRGTVQISVSVAPRIRIGHDSEVEWAMEGGGERFCLSSNDSGAFSVRISDEARGADGPPLPVPLAMPGEVGSVADADGALSLGLAGPFGAVSSEAPGACSARGLVVHAANLRGDRGASLLLLIAPD